MSPVAPITKALTLYEAEHELLALMDDGDDALTAEEEAQVQAEMAEALQYAVDKRERFGLFLLWLDRQQAIAKQEIERLRKRNERMDNLADRLRRYGAGAIKALGPDQKGRWRKLVGHTITLFIRALPPSVEIQDEHAVPEEFKRVTVQMSARLYRILSEEQPLVATLPVKEASIDKEAVRRAIEAGRDVPGADLRLAGRDHTLVVK